MKQRITYVVKNPEAFTPDQIEVNKEGTSDVFSIKEVLAAKEHRITLGLDELPSEIKDALEQWHELHIRWASPLPYTSTPPFTSRVSPGLHVFFTPLNSTPDQALCDQLQSFIRPTLECSSTAESSIKMPILSERFSMSASNQFYGYGKNMWGVDLSETARRMMMQFCKKGDVKCEELFSAFSFADYLDVDYDTITRAVVLNAGWARGRGEGELSETITRREGDGTVEIGVLNHESNTDPEDIQFGGFLVVLGQDESPKATRFQTPTRHYPLLSQSSAQTPQPHPLTYTTALQLPTGLHPTLTLSFPATHLTPPNPTCKLHTHLTLPSYLFIDKYQFNDPLFLSSKNIKSLRSIAGATDLEAPDWVVKQWGSAALFELAVPEENTGARLEQSPLWNISIPLHLRYLPASSSPHTRLPVPWPTVFWACRADEGAKMAANPFDRVHLGYEALFGPKTRFMHVEPKPVAQNGMLVEFIDVPVLHLEKTGWVEMGTVGTVLVAFLGLCWVLFRRGGKVNEKVEKKKQ